jgi:hypothetical protein
LFQIDLFYLRKEKENYLSSKMMLVIYLLLFVSSTSCLIYRDEIIVSSKEIEEINDENENAYSPLVYCDFL